MDQNFELAILLSIVEKHNKMSLVTTYSPRVPREGLQVTNFDQGLHIVIVIGKCTDVFRGIFCCWGGGFRGGSYVEGSLLGGMCQGGREIP